MKALLYCTKGKDYLVKDYDLFEEFVGFKITKDLTNSQSLNGLSKALNGKILAEIEIDKVEEIDNGFRFGDEGRYYVTNDMSFGMLLEKSCLSDKEIEKYLQEDIGYALHLTNLKVFDKPKDLSEYCVIDNTVEASSKYRKTQYGHYGELIEKKIFKAPQNMQVVFENGILVNHYCNFPRYKYVLISIQPQHLCNILNGKKTIEVRRKVINRLKEMI